MTRNALLIGCASGFSGDRADAALPIVDTLIEHGGGFLIFEALAERTLALAQLARLKDPDAGYDPYLEDTLRPILRRCLENNIRIVSNFGAANPEGAARCILRMTEELGMKAPNIAIVFGDAVTSQEGLEVLCKKLNLPDTLSLSNIISASVYLGAEDIAHALLEGADIVITGRTADPSLTVGPAIATFGWKTDDWDKLGKATLAGHLLECGAQVTGGYYAVPGFKDVPGMHEIGFPFVEIHEDGNFVVRKRADSGGCLNRRTVTEQLLYEVHDPSRYLTPDVTADFSSVTLEELDANSVAVQGATGTARPAELKANVFCSGGWLGEAEISYAGLQAEARAMLAADTLRKRIAPDLEIRVDLIGAVSVWNDDAGRLLDMRPPGQYRDIRLRIAAQHNDPALIRHMLREMTALYTCGPAGGGGVRTHVQPRLTQYACTLPRHLVRQGWYFYSPNLHSESSQV